MDQDGLATQHAYECLPLRTQHVKASDVLNFRDKAFNTYFKNSNYENLIKNTFGDDTVLHINKMTSFSLKKHHDQEVDY